ncbi:MAG: spore maturation protein [Deltaproteobacteria bacterium]|nr:spore maturation protein [Deltaproteobacteria bacterium]
MLNIFWVAMIFAALFCGAVTGKLDAVARESTLSAGKAVELAIGLVGIMALWIGLMQILQKGGLLKSVARALTPVMCRLFPDVPRDHPAMGMMILNFTANMLGLANAATPFGLKAMLELDRLNDNKGVASDSMVLFLAINTSNLALLPTGVISLRASLNAAAPASIFFTTLLSTTCSTVVAVIAVKALQRLRRFRVVPLALGAGAAVPGAALVPDTAAAEATVYAMPPIPSAFARLLGWALLAAMLAALVWGVVAQSTQVKDGVELGLHGSLKRAVAEWPLIILMGLILLYGIIRGVKSYDAVVDGGKEGFQVAVRIIPYLVAMLVAVAMLRASGALDLFATLMAPLTNLIGMPAETLPMVLTRPLSGTGAYAVAADIMRAHGTDSLVGQIVSTMQGSTETTFYVLALYYGVVGVRLTRHTIPACLISDAAGMIAAVWTCRLML